jgi:hypothetical protein
MIKKLFRKPSSLPYPVKLKPRDVAAEKGAVTAKGSAVFDEAAYQEINRARLAHVDTLHLGLEGKTVLDVGAGVGDLTGFFVDKGCAVTCVEGRSENVGELKRKFPQVPSHVLNVETDPLKPLGRFQVVFGYGLLYHLESPVAALRNMASACDDVMLLETMICDFDGPVMRLVDETFQFSQALDGMGCRPSPSFIVLALLRVGFPHVYAPKLPPDHPHFQYEWRNNLETRRNNVPLRAIFVASRTSLASNPHLVSLTAGGE